MACSASAWATAVVSLEQHSPIMVVVAGVPAVPPRQPTVTRQVSGLFHESNALSRDGGTMPANGRKLFRL